MATQKFIDARKRDAEKFIEEHECVILEKAEDASLDELIDYVVGSVYHSTSKATALKLAEHCNPLLVKLINSHSKPPQKETRKKYTAVRRGIVTYDAEYNKEFRTFSAYLISWANPFTEFYCDRFVNDHEGHPAEYYELEKAQEVAKKLNALNDGYWYKVESLL